MCTGEREGEREREREREREKVSRVGVQASTSVTMSTQL